MIKTAGKWHEVFATLLMGLKYYLYLWLLLAIGRLIFIGIMAAYISPYSTMVDVRTAAFLGMRMSMQTAGVMTIIVLLAYLLGRVFSSRLALRLANAVILIELTSTSILYIASFPYYAVYHSSFNIMMFTAVHEDWQALFKTFVSQFALLQRLILAAVLAGVLFYLWNRLRKFAAVKLYPQKCLGKLAVILLVFLLERLSLFGGSWDWQHQIDWENSAITKDSFLNEAILDDWQAVYRAYRLKERNTSGGGYNYTAADIRHFAADLSGKSADNDKLSYYLEKQAQGPKITQPQHIFLIISESYANWPLLPEYRDLHIAEGGHALLEQSDTAYNANFLPNGTSTVNALMGISTGLVDTSLYLTTMVDKMEKPYMTAIAPQLKKLGYTTNFYYAGVSSWENIEAFTKAQGFDHFYGRSDLTETQNGNVWGADDKDLYDFVKVNTDDQKSFNIILNVSNHSPFQVDLAANGFPADDVQAALAVHGSNDSDLLKELGHYWYEDKEQKGLIDELKARYPDSLFIIVGDHADRYNVEKSPDFYIRYAIPFIISGQGVTKDVLPTDAAGSQIDIFPTLMELIAPRGFKYYAVGKSLTLDNKVGINYAFAVTDGYIGKTDNYIDTMQEFKTNDKKPDGQSIMHLADALRAVSWWEEAHGNDLSDTENNN